MVEGGAAALRGGRVTMRWDWRDDAVCREADPELFFPVGDSGPALAQIARAKAVCAGCPVIGRCLSFAVVAIPEGVAGGLTAAERRALRARRRPVVAGVPSVAVVPLPGGAPRGSRRGSLPPGVDGLVVAALVDGQVMVAASQGEQAWAAVVLHRAGRSPGWIAARLGVHDRQVRRWLARARDGVALTPPAGPRGDVVGVA